MKTQPGMVAASDPSSSLNVSLLLVSCLLLVLGCDRAKALPPVEASATPVDNTMNHFWFIYRGQPDPGRRVWMRTSEEVWSELYPNGTISRYKRSGRTRINGNDGTTVRKVAGDPKATLTENDGSFEAFIPDLGSKDHTLLFRLRYRDAWSPWRLLVAVTPVDEQQEQ